METIKQFFGVLFLAVAVYLLQPLLPDALTDGAVVDVGDSQWFLDFFAQGARR